MMLTLLAMRAPSPQPCLPMLSASCSAAEDCDFCGRNGDLGHQRLTSSPQANMARQI